MVFRRAHPRAGMFGAPPNPNLTISAYLNGSDLARVCRPWFAALQARRAAEKMKTKKENPPEI
eukprot:9875642-Alexandrium_andersonii.AAC.1